MSMRMLIVDDDKSLLSSLRRNLCFDYELTVAASGPDALEVMQDKGPYSVVMTDMRMPSMNGLEFIGEARKFAPDTIYMMLTGNQDLETATRAVNDGQVFRFLTKPCEVADIRTALEAASRQFELVNAEKELLHKTFCGAVSAVIGVAEKSHPRLAGVGSGVNNVAQAICASAGLESRWEFKLAARVAPLGFALIELPPMQCDDAGFDPIGQQNAAYVQSAELAAELLTSIPRLELVSSIIKRYPSETAPFCHLSPKTAGAVAQVGASLLRLSIHTQIGLSHGMRGAEIVKELRQAMPDLHEGAREAIDALMPPHDLPRCELRVGQLKPGMVLAKDALSCDKAVMYRSGLRLGNEQLARLHDNCGDDARMKITKASRDAFSANR